MANDGTLGEELITMNLTFDAGNLFYDLYAALLSFVNRKLEVSLEQFSGSREYTSTPPEARVAIRDSLFAHRELIDEFVDDNPTNLKADDLEIVVTWKHAVVGKFYVFRYLKKYTVFLTSGGSPNKAYGVLGLADPLEEVIGPSLPRLVTTVLLPFRGKIIHAVYVFMQNFTAHFAEGVAQMPEMKVWARLLPPLEPKNAIYWIAMTTPFVLIGASKSGWTDFLKRIVLQCDGPNDPTRLHNLLKYGLEPNYWNEFVFKAYHHHQHDAVFLTGISDMEATLPHA